MTTPTERPHLAGIIETADDDRPSITEVNGTVARFEMAYSTVAPTRRAFGPPTWVMLPSLVYVGFAFAVLATVVMAHTGSSNSALYRWVVEGDRGRPLGSVPLTAIIVVSALATLIRSRMRGVIVTHDGVESRTILAMGIPQIKKLAWPQIDRMVIDDQNDSVILELWNGGYERLPAVKDAAGLARHLEEIAASKKKQVTHLAKPRG